MQPQAPLDGKSIDDLYGLEPVFEPGAGVTEVTQRRLLSVQVGLVAPLPVGDRHVMSGIRKTPVTGPVAVAPLGVFGENLTIQGLLEADVFVGDVLRFPDCELRATQPRRPCYKFAAVMDDPQAARAMVQTGFCGFYLAVDRPGHLAAGQSFELLAGARETSLMTLMA